MLPKAYLSIRRLFSSILTPPFFRTVYEIKDATHKQTIQRDTDNNRKEDTNICRTIDNNRVKNTFAVLKTLFKKEEKSLNAI